MSAPVTAGWLVGRNPFTAAWGALGVVAICAFAIWRLAQQTLEAFEYTLTPLQWAVLVGNVAFMAWTEGYRGFQRKFSPRAAARALYLYRTPTPVWTRALAPLFCFGYFRATRSVLVVTWSVTAFIVVLVLLIHQLEQPWRGVIDAGVVVGLTWGVESLCACYAKAFGPGEYPASPDIH